MSLRKKFLSDGYVVVDLNLNGEFLDRINQDVMDINNSEQKKKNPDFYHYNEYPRLIEAWRQSDSVRDLALNPVVLDHLTELYDDDPLPFSTINFSNGTEQPLHSDYVHFGSQPELMLAGVWVALEDISPESGPLAVVPKSHELPIFYFEDHNLSTFPPKSLSDVKANYTFYERWVVNQLVESDLETVTPVLKAGEALIWAANLLHGAGKIFDRSLTRKSQVTHYHFKSCDFFYNPNFSTRTNYVPREIGDSLIY